MNFLARTDSNYKLDLNQGANTNKLASSCTRNNVNVLLIPIIFTIERSGFFYVNTQFNVVSRDLS